MIFGINAVIVLKKNFLANSFIIYIFWKPNVTVMRLQWWGYSDEVTDFHDKGLPKVGSNYTCLAVI